MNKKKITIILYSIGIGQLIILFALLSIDFEHIIFLIIPCTIMVCNILSFYMLEDDVRK